jgi:hypothetical protein
MCASFPPFPLTFVTYASPVLAFFPFFCHAYPMVASFPTASDAQGTPPSPGKSRHSPPTGHWRHDSSFPK